MTASMHIVRVYDQQLYSLRDKLLLMGSLVEDMLRDAEKALEVRDTDLAHATIRADRLINRLECEIDELAMRILATRQPMASDLRFVTGALKIVTDLERIGDLCVNICERVVELNNEAPIDFVDELTSLSAETREILHEALDALGGRDAPKAMHLMQQDAKIDGHYARIFQDVLDLMGRAPTSVYRATRVQSIAKYLERVADHATNIAEAVVFLVRGTDIRHSTSPPAEANGAPAHVAAKR